MAHNDFGFSLSENSVNEINSLIEQYSQDIVSIMNGFQDDLIEHISTANYDKLLKAVDGIIEFYNNSVRYDLKTTILDKWQEACESMSSFAERMDMGEESEQVASEIEESLASVFEVEIENRLHEVDIDGRTSASIADFDSVNEIFDSVVKKVQELSDEFSEEAERLGEDNEFYKFIIPVVIAHSSGICSYFKDATKNLENLEDSYIAKMAEKKDAVQETKQEVDLSSLLDFSDLAYAGMGSISQNVPREKKEVSPVVDSTGISRDGDKTTNKYEELIKALSKFDGNECTYPELRRKYDEHLDKYKKGLDARVRAEYDKRDKQLKQYHTQLEQQLKNRHKELDGRYIKGTISLQQAEYLYAESCAKADQLYSIRERTLWAEYQNICQKANQMYSNEVTRCNQIVNKALSAQQEKCRELYNNRNLYIKKLGKEDVSVVIELKRFTSEIGKTCYGKCGQFKELCTALDIISNDDSFNGLWENIKQTYSPLNKELKGKYPRRNDKLTWSENLEKVNPHYANYPDGSELRVNYQFNCQRCVITYEARQRGFDVTAKPRKARYDNNTQKWKTDYENIAKCNKDANGKWVGFPEVYKNPIVEEMYYKDADDARQDIINKMVEYGKGSRIVVAVLWKRRGQVPGGGHVFIVENVNGKPIFCDPQTQKSGVDVEKYFDRVDLKKPIRLMRTDNLEFTDLVHECFG